MGSERCTECGAAVPLCPDCGNRCEKCCSDFNDFDDPTPPAPETPAEPLGSSACPVYGEPSSPAPEEATSPETANLRVRAKGLAMALDRAGETACAAEVRAITSDLFRMVEAPVTLPAPAPAEPLGSSACPVCGRDTPHSKEHHRVEDELLMAPAMGDANATWLRLARKPANLSLISILARIADRLIDEIVRLRQPPAAALRPGAPSEEGAKGQVDADPAGAARTALREAIMRARCESYYDGDGNECDGPDGCDGCLDAIAAAVTSHLAGQAGPEVRGLVERLMSPTAEGTIETRTALLAAFAQSAAERDRLAGLLALTEKSLHLAETGIEVQKRAVKRAKDEGQALAARLAEAENLCAAIGGCRECGRRRREIPRLGTNGLLGACLSATPLYPACQRRGL